LQAKGGVAGFSISGGPDGEDVLAIYRQEIAADDPNTVVLWANELPENAQLWYGRGLDPHCTLTDPLDMGVPTFGPLAIPAQ
jgi:sialate O-acetylesterase